MTWVRAELMKAAFYIKRQPDIGVQSSPFSGIAGPARSHREQQF
jgi:hypothetical protein